MNRVDIRNLVADLLDDYWKGTIAIPTIGTAGYTTITDTALTQMDSEYWRDADVTIAFVGGTYDTKRVLSYAPTLSGQEGGVLRLQGTLSLVPSTTDSFYIYKRYKADTYNHAISSALLGLARYAEVAHRSETLVATTYLWEYTVPTASNIDRVLNLYYLDADNYSKRVWLDKTVWNSWREGGFTKIRLASDSVIAEGNYIGIEGMGAPLDLVTDTQTLEDEIPLDYVINRVAADLRKRDWQAADADAAAQQVAFYMQTAQQALARDKPFSRKGRMVRRIGG